MSNSGSASANAGASASAQANAATQQANDAEKSGAGIALSDIPAYSGAPSVRVNGGVPFFDDADKARGAFEEYSPLDALGRCGVAFALVGRETMPTEERGSIGMIKPSGWQTTRYDWVDGEYLFNRCHLIGYQLAGENDNDRNLITGTRSLNTLGMLPFEDQVASYVRRTGNHVLYRVTPVFEGDELVARGVLIEALSVEDGGAGVSLCEWCYNVEPGVEIDYATGKSHASDSGAGVAAGAAAASAAGRAAGEQGEAALAAPAEEVAADSGEVRSYVLNTNTHRFHYPDCPSVGDMADHNKQFVESSRDDVIAQGYQPCGRCNP